MPQLGRLVVGLSPQRSDLRVKFVADKVALRQVILVAFRVSSCQATSHQNFTLIFILVLFLTEGRAGESWELSDQAVTLRKLGTVGRGSLYYFSFVFIEPNNVQNKQMSIFRGVSKISKKWLSAASCLPACLSAWNNSAATGPMFMKFGIFQKSVEKIQVSLKSDKNNRYFTWRPIYIFDHISLSSS